MSYKIGFAIGMIVAVLLGAGVVCGILIVTTKNYSLKREYDERQELVRGKGFKYGFFTMLITNFILSYLNLYLSKPIMDMSFAMILSMSLGVLVCVHYCIWKEGYFSLNEKPKTFIALMSVCAVVQYICFAGYLKTGIIINGAITFRGVNLLLGIMVTFLLIDLLVKSICQKREDD